MKWILSIALLLAVAGCPAANENSSTNKSSETPPVSNAEPPKPDKPETVAKDDVYKVIIEGMT